MVNDLETIISKHAKDLIQKYTSGLFRDATLEFYGIKTAKIKELINVELPVMEVGGGSADFVFLLEDESYLHFEFETSYNKKDLIRFAGYDIRMYERDGRRIITVIIYTSDVKSADDELNIGSMVYRPEKIMMNDYDGDDVFKKLTAKIKAGAEITDVDMLNLIFLPLMRNTLPRKELAAKSIELAQTIPDTTKRNACIAAAFAFANRYLYDNDLNSLLEVLKMTDLITMLMEDKASEIAKNALKEGSSVDFIKKITGLNESTILQLKSEIEAEAMPV
ncbi:MAG: hypothetical protein LBI04_00610, partial [Treponema sp.]|nr:hypothetical protein [Treponema sp.]